jgi:4-amino-4-deoxy-L-arabinose transferase-like glycosyltransferase
MNRLTSTYKCSCWALAACALFLVVGWQFLARLGVQNDEALFANGIYKPYAVAYALKIGHSRIPLMLMSYLGTLKSWIYRPIFQVFDGGIEAMRAPMLLAGAISVWVFYLLLKRISGERAAMFGCGLLAADSLYLLTVCFDWGPVALQHLLLVSGMFFLVRFYQERSHGALAAGSFLLGLAMWDKALAVWMLGGLGVALLAIVPRQILGAFTARRAAIAALAFAVGALPLIIYNVGKPGVTFRSNTSWDTSDLAGKARLLRGTADGSALFGWLNLEDWQTQKPHVPQSVVESATAGISALGGHVRHSLLLYAFLLAVLLTPLSRGNALRAIGVALVAMIVAWAQMAVTINAGGSVHHAILIWPLPQMVIAISFAAASRRLGAAGIPALAAMLAVLMISGLLVTNEYFCLIVRNGGSQNWTDAIFRLSDYLKGTSPENLFCVDWGMTDSLRLLNRGRLPLRVGTDPITKRELDDKDRETLAKMISSPANLFINHTKDFEFFAGVNDKLLKFASAAGYRREIVTVIADRNGRPVYEVYHFAGQVSNSAMAGRQAVSGSASISR